MCSGSKASNVVACLPFTSKGMAFPCYASATKHCARWRNCMIQCLKKSDGFITICEQKLREMILLLWENVRADGISHAAHCEQGLREMVALNVLNTKNSEMMRLFSRRSKGRSRAKTGARHHAVQTSKPAHGSKKRSLHILFKWKRRTYGTTEVRHSEEFKHRFCLVQFYGVKADVSLGMYQPDRRLKLYIV
ncbi:hypothetical protein DFJ77DRAFT_441700 [Powellomyces hirtus]|nr:hypothetical protein DFJ77DRAFT_441700 [Powellomyces hirtus]